MATTADNSSNRLRGLDGKFIGVKDPPLVDLKVANPVNYLKIWWAKIIGNEGVEMSFKIRPLTAIAIATVVGIAGFGVGRITVPPQVASYIPFLATPTPSPDPWRETAFTGVVRFSQSSDKYYLEVGSGETVTLQAPGIVNLSKLVGKRILAVGSVNQSTNVLKVIDVSDLEVLPTLAVPIPTLIPTPTPSAFPLVDFPDQ